MREGKPNYEKIGEGQDKRVYIDPINEGRIVAYYKKEDEPLPKGYGERQVNSPERIKAQYYLTKILNILFPKNIPEIYAAYSEPHITKAERKEHDSDLKKFTVLNKKIEQLTNKGEPWSQELIDEYKKLSLKTGTKIKDSGIVNKIGEEVGIYIDPNEENFTLDDEGDIWYLDTFSPWRINDNNAILDFDESKLENSINSLPKNDQVKAWVYLKRLMELYRQEQKKLTDKKQ